MFDHDNIAFNIENKRSLFIFAAVGTAVAGAVASTAVNAIIGGSGSSSGGTSASGTSSATPSTNVPTITSQNPLQEADSTAAKTYDPTAQMNSWSNIFTDMMKSKDATGLDISSYKLPAANVTPEGDASNASS